MSKSRITNVKTIDRKVFFDVEVYGVKKYNQSPRWYYAGKIEKNDDLITATHRKGSIDLFKVNDLQINYLAAQEWLEVQEFLSGTLLYDAYEFLDLIGDIKQRSPLELADILSSLPNYAHNQFIAMCKQELSPNDHKTLMSAIEKNRLFLNSDEHIFVIADQAMSDLGF